MSNQPVAPENEGVAAAEQPEEQPQPQKTPLSLQIWLVLMVLAGLFALVSTSNNYMSRRQAREREQQICTILTECGATKAKCGHMVIGGFHVDVQGWNMVVIERDRYDILIDPTDEDVRNMAKELKKLGSKNHKLEQDPDAEPTSAEPDLHASSHPHGGGCCFTVGLC